MKNGIWWETLSYLRFWQISINFFARLEDPDAKEVKDFVEKQEALTESVLHTCETRNKLRECITTVFNHPKYGHPSKHGDKYFYLFKSGLQAQSVLYVQVYFKILRRDWWMYFVKELFKGLWSTSLWKFKFICENLICCLNVHILFICL